MAWDWIGQAWDNIGETAGEIYGGATDWATDNVGNWLGNAVTEGSTQDPAGSSDTAQAIQPPPQQALTLNTYWMMGGAAALLIVIVLLIWRGK